MDMADSPQRTVAPSAPGQGRISQVATLTDLDQPLDDAAVRAAIVQAEAQGIDPMDLPMEALANPPQVVVPPVTVAQPSLVQQPLNVEVPPKFLKTDGTADVEKIQTSTRQLDEAIQKKEEAIAAAKSIDDYMRDYRERENKFRNLPNMDRLAAQTPPPAAPLPINPEQMTNQQLEEMIRRDYQADPIITTTRLIDIAIQKALEPSKLREQDDVVRKNVESLAARDPQVLDPRVFSAITEKLKSTPQLWSLPNPHRAAWLEVKEELRLGEPQRVQAQPSRPLSPVLGGGTPPSGPSSQAPTTPHNVVSNLDKLDLKDRHQEEMGDAAIRAILSGRAF